MHFQPQNFYYVFCENFVIVNFTFLAAKFSSKSFNKNLVMSFIQVTSVPNIYLLTCTNVYYLNTHLYNALSLLETAPRCGLLYKYKPVPKTALNKRMFVISFLGNNLKISVAALVPRRSWTIHTYLSIKLGFITFTDNAV